RRADVCGRVVSQTLRRRAARLSLDRDGAGLGLDCLPNRARLPRRGLRRTGGIPARLDDRALDPGGGLAIQGPPAAHRGAAADRRMGPDPDRLRLEAGRVGDWLVRLRPRQYHDLEALFRLEVLLGGGPNVFGRDLAENPDGA